MKPYTSSSVFFFGFLLALLALLFTGCQPQPSECDKIYPNGKIPEINFSDYCNPDFLEFSNLSCKPEDSLDLPDFCADAYKYSRVFSLTTKQAVIYLHRYRNFSSDITLEFIAKDKTGFVLLNSCDSATSKQMVSSDAINLQGHNQILVRIVYQLDPNEVLAEGERPTLSFAAFEEPFESSAGNDGIATDCTGKPFSLILSGVNSVAYAKELDLPYRVCKCDEGIVEINLPEGVFLDAVRPKMPKSETQNDTTNVSFNFVITPPKNSFAPKPGSDQESNKYSLEYDDFIKTNSCLLWNKFRPSDKTEDPLRVAIIDSGIDAATLGELIEKRFVSSQGLASCVQEGPFGYDFVNDDEVPEDEVGHGTLVASAFINSLRTDKSISLTNYKFIEGESGTLFDAICATSAAIENKSHLINMSWGFQSDTIPLVLENLFNLALQRKILIVTSAGNDTTDILGSPAYWPAAAGKDFPNVIPVASYGITSSGVALADFSNHNSDAVKIAAIYAIEARGIGNEKAFPAGTSISAPIVTSWLASHLRPGNDLFTVANQLMSDNTYVKESPALLNYVMKERYLLLPDPSRDCR